MHSTAVRTSSVKPAISLVLPAWNESEVILTAIAEADAALRLVSKDYEIIVVDDGSTDDTSALVRSAMATNPSVKLVQHSPNQGYGAALRSGFAAAEKDLVAFTDADCQFDLTELDRFILLARRYDVVCGYRIDRKDSFLRCFYSRVYNQLVRIALRTEVRDVDCALKMFHRDVVRNLSISGNGFLVNSEMLTQAKQQGYEIVEVGVSHRPRTEGTSTVSIGHIPKVLASLARYWWNGIQFSEPTDTTSVSSSTEDARRSSSLWGWMQFALIVVAAVFLLTNLGYPLIDRDETRYAEIPREMLATGNWILPQLNFETYYDKPPLVYWLCALSYQCFGVTEYAARLVPAMAALLTLIATIAFGSRNFDRKIGTLAGLVLMLSAGFMFTSRYLILDGALMMFVTLSMFAAYEAVHGDRVRLGWWFSAAVCCGLGFMTKGPVALALWLPPVLAFTWLSSSFAKPRAWHYALFVAAASMIVAPWMIAVTMQDASFLTEFFYKHNLRRFAGDFHDRPFWYFVPVLLLAGHPWSFLTIPYARFFFRQTPETRGRRPELIGFLMLWSLWCFVFFSLSRCKLPTYLLPSAPALALMMGHYLNEILRETGVPMRDEFARVWSARAATVATSLAGVGFVAYTLFCDDIVSPLTYLWAMLWTALLVGSVLMWTDRHQMRLAWASAATVTFMFAVMVMHQMLPAYSRSETLFGDVSALTDARQTPDRVVATVDHEFSEVPFYLDRSDIPNFDKVDDGELRDFIAQHDRTLLVLNDEVTMNELLSQVPNGSKIVPIGDRGAAHLIEVVPPMKSIRFVRGPKRLDIR